jgi:hypothetical protein
VKHPSCTNGEKRILPKGCYAIAEYSPSRENRDPAAQNDKGRVRQIHDMRTPTQNLEPHPAPVFANRSAFQKALAVSVVIFRADEHAGCGATPDENVPQAAGLRVCHRESQSGGLRYGAIFRADEHAGCGATPDENVPQAAGLRMRHRESQSGGLRYGAIFRAGFAARTYPLRAGRAVARACHRREAKRPIPRK